MSVEWIAFKANGDKFFSKETDYDKLPMNEIVGFSVVSKNSSMYVNLANGSLAINGRVVNDPNVAEYKAKHLITAPRLKLLFSKRAYVDFNPITNEVSGENLEYVLCGWQTYTLRICLKMNFPSEEIEIEIRETV